MPDTDRKGTPRPTVDIPDYPSRTMASSAEYRTCPFDDWIGMQRHAIGWKDCADSIERALREEEEECESLRRHQQAVTAIAAELEQAESRAAAAEELLIESRGDLYHLWRIAYGIQPHDKVQMKYDACSLSVVTFKAAKINAFLAERDGKPTETGAGK